MYPLKKPNNKPKVLSIEPTPVQVTALLNDFPAIIVMNKVQIKIMIPIPKLFINGDSMNTVNHYTKEKYVKPIEDIEKVFN